MPTSPQAELSHTLIALALVILASVLGSVSFALGRRLALVIPYLLSAAAGALLGTALFNLIPEALRYAMSARTLGIYLMAGFLFSFLLERLLALLFKKKTPGEAAVVSAAAAGASVHHSHEHKRSNGKSLITNVLLSGAVHSFIDGIGIAVAFTSSYSAGTATTLGVLLHEVPHHIADVGVLIYSGLSRKRAIAYNLLATSGSAVGGVLVLLFGNSADVVTPFLLPFTAANFIYIAVGILMPELQHETNRWRSILQLVTLAVAAFTIYSIVSFFPETH